MLAEQTIPRSENPLQYWQAHATQRPALADIATKFLCAPCTSVDRERLFSAVSNVECWFSLKKNLHYTKEVSAVD